MEERIRIFVVGDTIARADRLAEIFRASGNFVVTGAGSSADSALRLRGADVVVVKATHAGNGPSAERGIAKSLRLFPGSVLWLSRDANQRRANGLDAVLPPEATMRQIISAAAALAAGLHVGISHEKAPGENQAELTILDPLTDRELEVLNLVAEGFSNLEIAQRLGVSRNTVKFHVSSIIGKLGATSRTEAVTVGLRRGLIIF
jgi:DNA-binding NarL/FixJ family response regulator